MSAITETEVAAVAPEVPKDLQVKAPEAVLSPFTVETLLERVDLVKEAMRRAMQPDLHYGKIPGCGKKPVLLKPGAEMLGTLFNLGQRYRFQERLLPGNHAVYTVTCTQFYRPTGADIADGLGACSSMEYKWRIQTEPRTLDNGKVIPAKYSAHDFLNNALKIAAKRALVASIINATGVSSLFNQDIEEDPERYQQEQGSKPQPNGNHAPPAPVTLKGVVSAYESRASGGKLFHAAMVGESKVYTLEYGDTLRKLAGAEVSVLAVLKRPGLWELQSIQAVVATHATATKPAATQAEHTAYEAVQRQLIESDIAEYWALKAGQRLQFIPGGVQRLADLSEKQFKVLLVRFSDLIKAAREEEQGVVEEAAA